MRKKRRNCNENEDAMNAQRHRNEKMQRKPTLGRMQRKRTKQKLQRIPGRKILRTMRKV